MTPKEITLQLDLLKEKAKNYSFIGRSYKIDEIRSDVKTINDEINDFNREVDNILIDGIISNFNIDNWFEGFTDKTEFTEPNPRLVYEEKQREIERQKKLDEEKEQRELKELQKRQKQDQIDAFKYTLLYGPEDIGTVKEFIANGINVKDDISGIDLFMLFNHGRSLQFIELLIDTGMKITANDRIELERQKRIAREREIQNREAIEIQKKRDAEKIEREAEEQQKTIQAQQLNEFKRLCQDGPESKYKLNELIENGFDICKIEDFDWLESCISWRKSLPFIQLLVDSGILVKNKHIEYCYTNKLYAIISILEKAKNIENSAVKNIFKRKKNAMIGSISLTCIFIFSLFLPEILNRKMDSFYFILVGAITILSLIMAINFIVDFRKKSKINDINYILENQSLHPKQTGYEIPNIQGITGSVKEFNHKEIRSEKMILWIAFTLISISIIVLIYIFFEEIMGFFKILLILLLLPFLLPIILKKR